LEEEDTKTGQARRIPLSEDAHAALSHRLEYRNEHCPGSPWVFGHRDGRRLKDITQRFATACQRAGIEDLRIHDLRHTFASWLVMDGAPLTEVRDLLGHTTVRMTERYAHLAPDNHRSAIARLNRRAGRPAALRLVHGEDEQASAPSDRLRATNRTRPPGG
jgi:integrase